MKLIRALSFASLVLLASGCKKDPEVATVNGAAITQAQVDAFLRFKRVPGDDDKRREQALGEYLDREALASVIESEPVLDKALIDAELREARKETLISRYFEQFLA